MAKRSFKRFVEQELGLFPQFLIYAVLEWMLIVVLFIDGFLAFLANEFARFFELQIPCLLCTRIDNVLVHRSPDFYYNDSFCDAHKKDVSSLAFCHVHKQLSDIQRMCEGCLLSFATAKESDCETYKSLVGILHKDVELFVDVDQELHLLLPAGKKDEAVILEKSNEHRCSCCGEPLKVKVKPSNVKGKNPVVLSSAPAPSPRALFSSRNEDRGLDMSHIKYKELKLVPDESEHHEDDDSSSTVSLEKQFKEEGKPVAVPSLIDADEEDKTPNFVRNNRFFGIPLSDSAAASPRWPGRPLNFRKSLLERTDSVSETPEGNVSTETDGDSILHHLKRQVRLDRKSLMALYMELDEERSASAIAANNAMAMITRLQAEKAAVQMEALQYQRMMEEQAEYDQEALQAMNNLLSKRNEEIKELEAELEAYRVKYGCLREDEFAMPGEEESDEVYQISKPPSYSSSNGRSECGSPTHSLNEGYNNDEKPQNYEQSSSVLDEIEGEATNKLQKSFQADKVRYLGRLSNLDKNKQLSSDDGNDSSHSSSDNFDHKEEEISNTAIHRHNPSH
ncbi:hypothetical protein SLE2022_289640 [Rubroshorea leprosula]